MPLARYQFTVVDDAGNVLPAASVEVRREAAGAPIASIFSDREGATPLGNPFVADGDGYAAFHAAGGAYRITASKNGFSREWRYVGIGLASESDGFNVLTPRGMWDVATSYDVADLVEHEGFAFASNVANNLANEPTLVGSPPTAGASDEFWTVINAAQGEDGAPGSSDVTGTSTTSVELGTPAPTFTIVEDSRGWAVGARLRVSRTAAPTTHYMEGVITAYSGNSLDLAVDLVVGTGTYTAWTLNLAGEEGTPGADGNDGADGTLNGYPFLFDSSTSMADPGAGDFRLNNATLASVTAAAFDDLSAASGNPDVSAAVLTWDDSTSTVRGYLTIKDAAAPQNFAVYAITGASTDNVGWTQLALTHVASAGSFTNGNQCTVEFSRTGDLGATGPVSNGLNAQTGTSYQLALSDVGKVVSMNNASSNTVTIPTNATVAFAVGDVINVVQRGAGVTTIDGAVGVTVNGVSGGNGAITARWQGVALLKVDTNEWIASGSIGTVA